MQLAQFLGEGQNSSVTLEHSAKSISNAADELTAKIDNLPILIRGVEKKVDLLGTSVLESFQKTSETKNTSTTKTEKIPTEIIDNYIHWSSRAGLLLLYALSLAFKDKREFDLSDLCKKAPKLDFDYCYGYLVSSTCFDLLDVERNKKNANLIKITKYNDYLLSKIKDECVRKGKYDEEKRKDGEFNKHIELIDKYF